MRFFHDITVVTLSWSEAFDLTGVGPHFGHPPAPLSFGDGPLFPHSFQTDRPCSLQNGPFGSESSAFSLLKYMLDVNGQLDTFWPKTSSCLHNPKHSRRNSLCRCCTFHRKPDFPPSLPCIFSAGLTGYLLLLPQRLNRGERAFCGIEAICIAN